MMNKILPVIKLIKFSACRNLETRQMSDRRRLPDE